MGLGCKLSEGPSPAGWESYMSGAWKYVFRICLENPGRLSRLTVELFPC